MASRPSRRLLGAWLLVAPLSCGPDRAPAATVPEQAGRRVLVPTRVGWVSSEQSSAVLPSAIALGGKMSGWVLMYFEFAALSESRRLLRADLILDASGAPGESLEVELSRAEAAGAELRAWSDQPLARYPRLAARLYGGPVRLNVTELLRVETKPGEPLRLLLRAEPDAAEPMLVVTGAAGGATPRLDVYWE